jgi:glycosyltransferase involved in cell wall biosynthesis
LTLAAALKELHILIITPKVPFPLETGGNVAQFAVLEILQKQARVTVCMPVTTDEQFGHVKELEKLLPRVSFELIDLRAAEAAMQPSVIRKTLNVVKNSLKKRSAHAFPDGFDHPKRLLPIQLKGPVFCKKILELISSRKVDIVQLEFFETLDLVHLVPASMPKIFVHHEIRFAEMMSSALTSSKEKSYTDYVVQNIKEVEFNLLSKFDRVIAFSQADKEILSERLNDKVVNIPFPVLEKDIAGSKPPGKFNKLVFVGTENHYPNKEGLKWFIENCFEETWNEFHCPLYVVGKWSEETVHALGVKERIIFTGFVPDLKVVTADAIMVIPVRIGSGVRAKALHAMAGRIPIISTPMGVAGIEGKDGEHFIIANDKKGFADAIGKMKTPGFAEKILDNASALVRKNYSQEHIVKQRMELYRGLIKE